VPAAAGGAHGGHRPAARESAGGRSARLRAARSRLLNYNRVPGLVEVREAKGETTLVVDAPRLREAAAYLRDELGFNFLSDIAAADYLGWGGKGISGYIGTGSGRDLNKPSTQGLQRLPRPKPRRFSVSYHLLTLRAGDATRVRLQVWVDDGEAVPSVVSVWPTADWHEREAWDLFGIRFDGHPNPRRILMDDDWEGHPLRKDYPIGGEPVRFSGEE
jgi:NADH/F420H2 dehydrogenase subunit C